jgi:ubiquinone/menaquinone biosynthesis C-methylase UbiE
VNHIDVIPPRSEYVDFWNTVLAPKFNQWRHVLVGGLSLHSARTFPELKLSPSDAVVDVGCGWGETSIEIARRVGPGGKVVGVDCCGAFLDAGRADAREAGLSNVEFVEADAEAHPFASEFDFCFSRFGTQFFQNPVVGLRNMRSALKPGGTMTMIVWRSRSDNPWLNLPREVLLRHLPPVDAEAATCGPGPFSMAETDVVTKQLMAAGYSDVEFKRIDAEVMVGRTVNEAIEFQLAIGPAGEVYRTAGQQAEQKRDILVRALEEALREFARPEGVMLSSSSWLVTARNPM